MKLTNIIQEAKEETDIHRQYEVGDAFWSPMGKGELFILLSPYTAAKGGIVGLVRGFSRKLAPEILVNGLAPGVIDTRMPQKIIKTRGKELISQIPQKRFGRPEEVASVTIFLLSKASSYMTGQILNVDGGIINS